ncbi:MAG: alpha/beta hydrolase family protein [Acidimicrobiales bacterium]
MAQAVGPDLVGDEHVVTGFPDQSQLSLPTRLVVETSAAADVALRTAAATLVTASAAPLVLSRRAMTDDRESLEFYADLAAAADPERTFPRPDPGCRVESREVTRLPSLRRGRRRGRVELLHFESRFEVVNPAFRKRYARRRRNRTAWAQHWRHADGPRPTLGVIHGFMASPYWVNRAFFSLPWFYRRGYDVLLYTLPYHGRRRSRLEPFSGYGLFAGGIANFCEAMCNAVHDFRVFVDHLESLGAPAVGLTGLSLGGYTTALLAATDDRLHVAIPNAAVTDLSTLVNQWAPAGQLLSLGLRLHQTPRSLVDHALSVHSPLTYPCLVPKDRRFIIAGLGDRLAPPEQSEALWEHWDRCLVHWFPGNHTFHVRQGTYLKQMARFLDATGFNAR